MTLLKTRYNDKLIYFSIAGLISTFLISLALLQVFAFLLFFLWLFEKNKSVANDSIYYVIVAFAAIRLISILFSEYLDSSLVAIQKELLFYLIISALYFYIKTFSLDKNIRLIKIFIHSGSLVALIGLILFSMGKFDRAQSFGSGYATYSTYLLVVLMFILSFHPKEKRNSELLTWAGEVGLVIAGIVLSMGRANIAIALVLSIVIIFLRRISLKKIGLAAVFAIVITFITLQFNPGESAKRMSNPTTLSDRDVIYQGFWELADGHPILGFGPRTFHEIFPYKERLVDKGVGSWHNDYIQIYLESGIFALLIFLWLIFLLLKKSDWVIIKPQSLMIIATHKFAVIMAILSILLAGVTGTFLLSPVLSILFAYLISLFSFFWYIEFA